MENEKMKVDVDTLVEYLHGRYADWANEQGLFMKLVEEVGEVAEILNMRAGRKTASDTDLTHELGVELADIIHYVVAIAAINEIDLAKIMIDKDRVAAVKYNHKINLEDFIKEKTPLPE